MTFAVRKLEDTVRQLQYECQRSNDQLSSLQNEKLKLEQNISMRLQETQDLNLKFGNSLQFHESQEQQILQLKQDLQLSKNRESIANAELSKKEQLIARLDQ